MENTLQRLQKLSGGHKMHCNLHVLVDKIFSNNLLRFCSELTDSSIFVFIESDNSESKLKRGGWTSQKFFWLIILFYFFSFI